MNKILQVSIDILVIKEKKLLLGLLTRKWQYNGEQVYGVPGRDIHFGEKIGEAVIRNIKEDLNCEVKNYKVINVNANYALGSHVIGIGILAEIEGEITNLHPEDWEKWEWFDLDEIPTKLFPSAKNAIESYLTNKVCVSE